MWISDSSGGLCRLVNCIFLSFLLRCREVYRVSDADNLSKYEVDLSHELAV